MKPSKIHILVLHGPNLNLLGEREPEIYGTATLARLNARLRSHARARDVELRIHQDNHEGGLIDLIHQQRRWAQGLVINPGAYAHYSYALRDAIAAVNIPAIEVHLSDIRNREPFRRRSVIAPVCGKMLCANGVDSYLKAIDLLTEKISAGERHGPLGRHTKPPQHTRL
ncbi:MAG TPA: 3-dehydroquinate dehydratase [Elusimicrobia bacterium]|nr:3-dehydroquinate dehydratase [Elusimicrobiota bacterium]HBT61388.1 3-dehydroquinate dehydratase [Elusimicrobiota bacterium]